MKRIFIVIITIIVFNSCELYKAPEGEPIYTGYKKPIETTIVTIKCPIYNNEYYKLKEVQIITKHKSIFITNEDIIITVYYNNRGDYSNIFVGPYYYHFYYDCQYKLYYILQYELNEEGQYIFKEKINK
jgi:hypothetical protein